METVFLIPFYPRLILVWDDGKRPQFGEFGPENCVVELHVSLFLHAFYPALPKIKSSVLESGLPII